ncbi:MAG: DUF1501 domain-containing protein [Pseudomonadota bacterium]
MTMMTRRMALSAGIGVACSAAAFPISTPIVHAALPGEKRLVVIVLRGAMDGLDVVQPYGDRNFAALRPTLAREPGDGLADLDGFFGLHAAFKPLMPLWQAGELSFAHAVATPYRGRRSHFDGQDALELGAGESDGSAAWRDGWLNRALGLMPAARLETAVAVGRDHMLILDGKAAAGSWSPTVEMGLIEDERGLLTKLYEDDVLFHTALAEAAALSEMSAGGARKETGRVLADYTAKVLNGPSRIAAFSLGGWDTHRHQARAMKQPAKHLATAITTLRDQLGRNWDQTLVVALTEFGRTARENGSTGTDHGTGGIALMAGGAVKGGKVLGRWPGLGTGDLYEDRDLMATEDVRRYAGWALSSHLGLSASAIEGTVFPGLDLGRDPGIVA